MIPRQAVKSRPPVVPPPSVYGRQRRGRPLVETTGHNIPTFTPSGGDSQPLVEALEDPTVTEAAPVFDLHGDFDIPEAEVDPFDVPDPAMADTLVPPPPSAPRMVSPAEDAVARRVHYVRPRRTAPGMVAPTEHQPHTPRYQRNLTAARARLRTPPERSEVQSVADRFLLRHVIGEGVSAQTHMAWDRLHDRFVALKLFREGSGIGDAARNFLDVASRLQQIRHPNLTRIVDAGVWQDRAWLAVEHLDGETLQARLERSVRPLPLAEAVDIAAQVAAALTALHRRGIVHADLKAANVFLTTDGFVKVADAGLPRRVVSSHSGRPDGLLVGTPGFLSPERIRGLTAGDEPSDLFSLGVLLYWLFTHRRPFDGNGTGAILAASIRERPATPLRYRRDLPPQLENLTLKCLAPDPRRRPQSARAAASVLQHFTTIELVEEPAPGFG